MFLQGCIHQSFFDLIGKDGFNIRNVTPEELYNEIISKLPEDWLCAEDNDEEEEDKVKKSWHYNVLLLLTNFSHLIYLFLFLMLHSIQRIKAKEARIHKVQYRASPCSQQDMR